MSVPEPQDFLEAFPSAAELGPEMLADFLRRVDWLELEEGAVLFSAGDLSDRLLLIVTGMVLVAREMEDEATVTLGRLGRGDMVGEMGLLDGSPRSASARVDERATLLSLHRAAYEGLKEEGHPAAAWLLTEMNRGIASRVRATTDRIVRLRAEPELAALLPEEEVVSDTAPWYRRILSRRRV